MKNKEIELAFRFLFILLLLALISCSCSAQNARKDKDGNYIAIAHLKDSTGSAGTNTGKTYTDSKGKVYPVYVSDKGKLFVRKTSKAGNEYKMYLKL